MAVIIIKNIPFINNKNRKNLKEAKLLIIYTNHDMVSVYYNYFKTLSFASQMNQPEKQVVCGGLY